ncbi:MAG: PAS domain S-box protein [Beijerinckiaceae bacterium]|nr:PAS domain S-box protein [Beijerinckiaceae bacterium]
MNYLDACRQAIAEGSDAEVAFNGVSAVLAGDLPLFELIYSCHSDTEQRWFLMTVAPFGSGASSGAIVSHLNVTERKRAELALQASEARFRAALEHAVVGIGEMRPDGRWTSANDRLCAITGYTRAELLTKSMHDIVHPDDVDAKKALFEVMRAGGADSCHIEQRLLHANGSIVWINITFGCVRKSSGEIDFLIVSVADASEQKLVERRQQTLLHELAHRGKNMLAVIQSIVGRSLSGHRSLPEAREVLTNRLRALSKTYEAVADASFDGVLLDVVLRNELKSFAGRFHLEGPSILLTDKAAQTMALVAHELATNACKYGALSAPTGHLQITWGASREETSGKVRFDWRETGGPPVRPPTRRGFGATLITQVAGSDFQCKPETNYTEEGFHYCFDAPLERLGALVSDSPVRRKIKNAVVRSLFDTWARQRPASGLPSLAGFDWGRFAATGALTIANLKANGDIQFAQVGRVLMERLGDHEKEAENWVNDDLKSLVEVYRRCAQGGEPCHEMMRIDFADGDPFTFERLLAPFSAIGGRTPSHVVGLVVIEGNTRSGQEAASVTTTQSFRQHHQ